MANALRCSLLLSYAESFPFYAFCKAGGLRKTRPWRPALTPAKTFQKNREYIKLLYKGDP